MASELNPLARTLSLAVHGLRTPLAVASGYLRMLLRGQAGVILRLQLFELGEMTVVVRQIKLVLLRAGKDQ